MSERFTPEQVAESKARLEEMIKKMDEGPAYRPPHPNSPEIARYHLERRDYRKQHPDGAPITMEPTQPEATVTVDIHIDESLFSDDERRLRDGLRDGYILYTPPTNR